jgi:hypothetical protein
MVNGAPVLDDDQLSLARHVEYAEFDVLIGFSRCSGTGSHCSYRYPFWIILRKDTPAFVRHARDLPISPTAGRISVDQSGIHVSLGLFDGSERTLTIAGAENPATRAKGVASEILTSETCAVVADALADCTTGTDCGSFENSSEGIAYEKKRELNWLFHQTTGFSALNFATLCVSSCRFGATPSRQFIEREVCAGASPRQWRSKSLAWLTDWAPDSASADSNADEGKSN